MKRFIVFLVIALLISSFFSRSGKEKEDNNNPKNTKTIAYEMTDE
jgi:hypothetical protein